jgi:hypothetical protein
VNWLLVIVPALVSGVLGSIVTTYGTQARERRAARTEVRTKLQLAEQLARHADSAEDREQLVVALDHLEGAALTAALPHYLIRFYREMRLLVYETGGIAAPGGTYDPRSARVISIRLANSTAALVVRAIWHPWLSGLTRRWRMRRLRQILSIGMPDARKILVDQDDRRAWERGILRGGAKDKDSRSTVR